MWQSVHQTSQAFVQIVTTTNNYKRIKFYKKNAKSKSKQCSHEAKEKKRIKPNRNRKNERKIERESLNEIIILMSSHLVLIDWKRNEFYSSFAFDFISFHFAFALIYTSALSFTKVFCLNLSTEIPLINRNNYIKRRKEKIWFGGWLSHFPKSIITNLVIPQMWFFLYSQVV